MSAIQRSVGRSRRPTLTVVRSAGADGRSGPWERDGAADSGEADLLLASHVAQAPNAAWYLGLAIGSAVVVVVVAVLAALLTFASRMKDELEEARAACEETSECLAAVRERHDLTGAATALVDEARAVRRGRAKWPP